ncbi:MAG TPA: ATP-binding cassette domain-containing protein [Actinomycetes bacterium]
MTSYLDDDPADARAADPRYRYRPGDPLPDRVRVTRIEASGLGFARSGRQILDDVSLEAYAGEALAVTGPSGSGKSSLLAILAGLERADQGEVLVDDQPMAGGVPRGYALVLQGYGLVSVLTAAENVEVVLQGLGLSRRELRDRAGAVLEAVGLDDVADHLVEQLSGGQQQRVAVARALVVEPAVLVADEFTAELDADSRGHVLNLVLGVARRGGLVVIATHDPAVAGLCNAELRLADGRVLPAAVADPEATGGQRNPYAP